MNTPQTDSKATGVIGFYSCETVPANFARKLELENAQMLDALKGVVRAWGGHMRDDNCGCADCEYLRPVVAAIAAASLHNAEPSHR